MSLKEFKWRSEGAFNLYLKDYQILQQTEFKEFFKTQKLFNENNPCNIYFILRRPRLSIDESQYTITKECIELTYYVHIEGRTIARAIKMPNDWGTSELKLQSKYPHKYFDIYLRNGQSYNFKLTSLVDQIQYMNPIEDQLLDFEVLYIGQTNREDRPLGMIDRLGAHSTLQEIYSDLADENPDSEVWILLGNFSLRAIAAVNGFVNVPQENENTDVKRFMNFIDPQYTSLSESQRINLTEASLIRTFQPKYNNDYKNTFPSQSHIAYSKCYSIDLNSVYVETDTSEIKRCLYTKGKPRNEMTGEMFRYYQHGIHYFIKDNDRYQLFDVE